MKSKLGTPIYLEVIELGNGNMVCCISNGCDDVPLMVRQAMADLLMDRHTYATRGTLGGSAKLYGISYFPDAHRYDYITPAGLMADNDFRFYELSGSLKSDLTVGSTISFIVRDGETELGLDSDLVMRAHATGKNADPIKVVRFQYHDASLAEAQVPC